MKRLCMLSVTVSMLVAVGLGGCKSSTEDKKTTLDDMQKTAGNWKMVSGEMEGKPIPEQDVKDASLTIAGDTYTVQVGDLKVKGTQKLDSTKIPKHIDAHDTEGPNVGLNVGIYEFTPTGDFRVCFALPGKDRPTEFATTPGSGRFMHVWRQAKAE